MVWKCLEHVLYFHSVGTVIIPTDFHIFQRGRAQPPTSHGSFRSPSVDRRHPIFRDKTLHEAASGPTPNGGTVTNLMETPAKIGKFMEVMYIYIYIKYIYILNIYIIYIYIKYIIKYSNYCYYYMLLLYYYCCYIVLYIYRSIYLWMPFYIFYDILRIWLGDIGCNCAVGYHFIGSLPIDGSTVTVLSSSMYLSCVKVPRLRAWAEMRNRCLRHLISWSPSLWGHLLLMQKMDPIMAGTQQF